MLRKPGLVSTWGTRKRTLGLLGAVARAIGNTLRRTQVPLEPLGILLWPKLYWKSNPLCGQTIRVTLTVCNVQIQMFDTAMLLMPLFQRSSYFLLVLLPKCQCSVNCQHLQFFPCRYAWLWVFLLCYVFRLSASPETEHSGDSGLHSIRVVYSNGTLPVAYFVRLDIYYPIPNCIVPATKEISN
jgi:hypothetical protein